MYITTFTGSHLRAVTDDDDDDDDDNAGRHSTITIRRHMIYRIANNSTQSLTITDYVKFLFIA